MGTVSTTTVLSSALGIIDNACVPMGEGNQPSLILHSHGFVRQEACRTKKKRQGMTRNGYYAIIRCVKNIAKGRYGLTPKLRHRFKILSAICLDPLSAGLFMNDLPG